MPQQKSFADERMAFSRRLKGCLEERRISTTPAALARGFNLRAAGAEVTAHAARKWLKGEAIPAQQRIVLLSKWLNVNAAWLRFGHDGAQDIALAPPDASLSASESVLMRGIVSLSKPSQAVVAGLVESLKRLEEAIGPHKE